MFIFIKKYSQICTNFSRRDFVSLSIMEKLFSFISTLLNLIFLNKLTYMLIYTYIIFLIYLFVFM